MNHPDPGQLAELAEGLLDDDAAAVRDHVAACSECRSVLRELTELPAALAQTPAPQMPSDVQDRIERALRAEAAARRPAAVGVSVTTAGGGPGGEPASSDELAQRRRRGRLGRSLLAAAAVVVVAGIGGTVAVDVLGNSGGATNDGSTAAQSEAQSEAQSRTQTGAPSSEGHTSSQADGAQSGPQAVAPRDQEQAGLIQEVYLSRTVVALRERATCVGAALSDLGWQGSSYAVHLPGGGPGAVAFQPAPSKAAPGEQVIGLLIRCGERPQVLDRQSLAQ